jgi:excisionase family DNA binding protein
MSRKTPQTENNEDNVARANRRTDPISDGPARDPHLSSQVAHRAPPERVDKVRRATIDVAELAVVLGVSKGTAWAAVRRGQIPSIAVGARRRVVPVAALAQFKLHEDDIWE